MELFRDERLARAYDGGNAMPSRALWNWIHYLCRFAPPRPDRRILDVGSGTGVFTAAMAQRCGASLVLGIEPSPLMLTRARHGPRVRYVQGRAEALPIRSSCVDLILLSRVVHHLADRVACAREFNRVVDRSGRLVIRTTLRERLDAVVYEYFPELLLIDRQRFPRLDQLVTDFGVAGWSLKAAHSHAEPVAASLAEYRDRLALRPQSKFQFINADAFAGGVARISAAAKREGRGQAVYERYDVLLFEAGS